MSAPLVLDKRGLSTRVVTALWRRWDGTAPVWIPVLSAVTRPVIRAGTRRRLASRDVPPDRPRIVSVGALASGGSGKTPVTLALAAELAARGERVGLVTRGYGSRLAGPLRVDPDDRRCGDEARLLARRLPGAAVVQSRDRRAGIAHLRGIAPDTSLVLLEDGHQCAGAGRHLDVLILDRWRLVQGGVTPETGRLLPWGPYREEVSGAARARLWLLPLDDDADPPAPVAPGPTVLGFRRRNRLPDDVAADPASSYGVVSGLAAPERFEAACTRLTGRSPTVAARFADHAAFPASAVAETIAAGEVRGVVRWLTTAKDHVKLSPAWPADAPPLCVVDLELAWAGGASPADTVLSLLEA